MAIASTQNMDNALVNQWLQKQHGVGADYRPDIPALNSWLSPYLANGTLDMNRVPEIAAAIRANDPSGTANISGGWVPGGNFAGAPITSVGGGNVNFDSTANTGDLLGNLILGAAMSSVAGLGFADIFGAGALTAANGGIDQGALGQILNNGYASNAAWGSGVPGLLDAPSPLSGAAGSVVDGVAPAATGWGSSVPAAMPELTYTMQAPGIGAGSAFNVIDAPGGWGSNTIPGVMGEAGSVAPTGGSMEFSNSLNNSFGPGPQGAYAGLGELSTPQSLGYQGIGMDTSTSGLINQYAPMSQLSTGNAAWDAMINGGSAVAGGALAGAASLGPVASLAKSLGISEAAALKVLGAGGGALLGSLNGSKPAGTTTTTTDIPEWLKPYAIDILNKGQAQTNAPQQDFSQSDALLKNVMAGTANPYSQQDNPYFEKTLNLALNDTQGRVNNQFRNSAFGGSANQELLARNLGDQANNLRFGQYKNAQDLYTTDLNRATNVATGMPQYSAQKTQSNFQPLLNQKSLLGFGGSQTSSPYFSNPTSGALYGGLLGSQLFGGK